MSSSANTFGTFLETLKVLESGRPSSAGGWSTERDILVIAKTLARSAGATPLKEVIRDVDLPQDAFLNALFAGRDKGLFKIDEEPDEPAVELTKLGRSIAS
jgi:hypothetical protein